MEKTLCLAHLPHNPPTQCLHHNTPAACTLPAVPATCPSCISCHTSFCFSLCSYIILPFSLPTYSLAQHHLPHLPLQLPSQNTCLPAHATSACWVKTFYLAWQPYGHPPPPLPSPSPLPLTCLTCHPLPLPYCLFLLLTGLQFTTFLPTPTCRVFATYLRLW